MKPFPTVFACVCACACALAALGMQTAVLRAQTETTASLGGTVTAADSPRPVGGARVSLKLASTGETLTTRANTSGQYLFAGLRVDDGYTLTVTAPGYDTPAIGPFSLALGEQKQLDITLATTAIATTTSTAAAATPATRDEIVQLERMVVTARREQPPPGSSTTISETEIEDRPATNESTINDYATSDPRITMLDSETGEIAAAGQNVRFNSIQVDGVRIDDMFGLAQNGLPTEMGNPFSMETVQSISVDLAPYDVARGGFTGASINAVTKSGSNLLAGSAFYSYRDEKFKAADPVTGKRTPYTSVNYGLTLGGPILKNRLFFFVSWERSLYTNPAQEVNFTPDTAAVERIIAIARDQYAFDAGSLTDPGARSRQSDRYLAKIDWLINPRHRLTLAYNGMNGSNPVYPAYASTTATSLSSHWYVSRQTMNSLNAQLVSKWTDSLQTQLSAARQRIIRDATPNSAWPQVTINNIPAADPAADPATLYIGPNYLYQTNNLTTNVTQAQATATLLLGKHRLEFGGALIRSDFTNTYLPYAWGSYTFSNIDAFATGYFNTYNYQRPLTPDGSIPAVHWGYTINTLYLQDTWRPHRALTLTAGLRYDLAAMPDRPRENTAFEQTFAMRNDGTIDGAATLGPRASFTWTPGPLRRLRLRGGAGLFQGRAPGAWLSNAFTDNGATSIRTTITNNTTTRNYTFLQNTDGATLHTTPTTPPDWAASATTPSITMNLMDKNLRLPAVIRGNLALDLQLPWQRMTATIEWLYTRAHNSLVYRNINLRQTATAPDGRPLYGAWTLATTGTITTDSKNPNPAYLHPASPDGAVNFDDVYLLTNADRSRDKSQSSYLTLSLKRPVQNHWGLAIAYTRGHATEVSPFTNSVAATNYARRASVDPNSDETGAAATEVRDRVLTTLTLRPALIRKWNTTLALVYDAHSGRPYSYTFRNDANGDGITTNDLFYVPSGRNDPKVYWFSQAEQDAFFAYLATNNNLRRYAGQIVPRNSERSQFVHRVDLHLTQQIPLYGKLRAELVLDIINLTNLLNPNWGEVWQYNSPYAMKVASAYYDARTAQYQYRYTAPPAAQTLQTTASRWQIQAGMKVKF